MKFLIVLSEILVLFCCVQCQIENGWKGIKVFETSRAEVEKILGKPKEEKLATKYEIDDALVDIYYSREPCSNDWRGAYNIKRDTILEYTVYLKDDIPLSEFKWQKENYKRTPDPEVLRLV